ncbi:sensor histidine kinase [Candidatus Merdisoma sp. JLR.KK011]|uniref:sensor histidine kinase n=1 Tax=Candidatus Merdisoma sp. JLR.KK011 TaxID=3114299 RepID=UPI002FF17750
MEQGERKRSYRLTLKMRLSVLLFVTAIPLTGMMLGILTMIQEYSDSYNSIMANLKVANEYNIKFKEDMEYSMYRVMIGLIDASKFENGDILEGSTEYATVVKNPINMIESARHSFGTVIDRVPGTDSYIKIQGILSCLDTLETAVNRMIANSVVPGTYGESAAIWENDIKGLCSMIQDYITQYTYYELMNMEELQKQLEEQVNQSVRGFMALLVSVLAAGLVLSTLITKSVTTPINSLRQTAERFGMGDLEVRARMYALEEINVLSRTFNTMSDKIAELMKKTKQEQKNLREAELKLHQEQINPHFLYNTLDSIVWLAEGGNNQQVVEMTADLSDFFRTVLSGGNDYITVAEEESHIRSYLKIQKIRYENILDYSIFMEPGIKGEGILKMTLQPIVENALYHGIKNKRGGGKITIRGYGESDYIVFEVEDNGIGMDEETLKELKKKLRGEKSRLDSQKGGFGLNNVAQRIHMYYGDESEITITSEKHVGTCVRVRLGRSVEAERKKL